MYLVLIDRRIKDIPSIVNSLTENTEYLTFEHRGDIESIKKCITGNYESVAIIQHKYNMDVYRFVFDFSNAILDNLEQVDPELESWTEYIDFLLWLKNERGANYIDIMACDLWSDSNWRYMIEKTRSKYGIYIRASLDKTGTGGNFILESDNFDTIGVYFTENILQYRYYFFDYPTTSQYTGFINYNSYNLPSSNLAKVSSRYSSITDRWSSTTYTDIVSSTTNDTGAVAFLRSNGTLILLEFGLTGNAGRMPCGVVTAADLVNIKKVVAGNYTFVALKNDGTVICWGRVSQGDVNNLVNLVDPTDNNYFVNVDSVRSELVNIVDIYANGYDAFAALSSTGKAVTWGYRIRGGGNSSDSVQTAFKSSGVVKIVPGVDSFSMLKSDGTAMILGGWGNVINYSTSYFNNSTPIVDMFLSAQGFYTMYVRQNGSTYDLIRSHSSSVLYTLPQGVTVLKCVTHANNYLINFFILLSNGTVASQQNGIFTLYSNNVTDIECTLYAFAMIQNGTVVVSGNALNGGSLTGAQGLKSGLNLTNPVRLVSSSLAFGVIKSDQTFVWWGYIIVAYGETYSSSIFPTNALETTLFNAMSSNIKTVYGTYSGFVAVKNDGSIAAIGNKNIGYSTSNVIATKDANTNVNFITSNASLIIYEIPYSPSVSPGNALEQETINLSYYVSDPDLACLVGRKYQLFNGTTLMGTFYPRYNNHTYVFSNVTMSTPGTITFDIKDTTNISYTVTSFSFTVASLIYPCFLEGSKILRMNPETDNEEYIAVEKLRRGDLIRTAEHGYKAIELIGHTTIPNPMEASKESRRLYWFRKSKCANTGLFEDLCVTGDHCILHRTISDEKRKQIAEYMRDIYVTENHYRVPAFLDDRAEPYTRDGPATIWHFALENPNIYHNYGVMANGLLVESCSLHYMYKHSNMRMIE
jgi:hypothetical protein